MVPQYSLHIYVLSPQIVIEGIQYHLLSEYSPSMHAGCCGLARALQLLKRGLSSFIIVFVFDSFVIGLPISDLLRNVLLVYFGRPIQFVT